jgi:hypothetical protein
MPLVPMLTPSNPAAPAAPAAAQELLAEIRSKEAEMAATAQPAASTSDSPTPAAASSLAAAASGAEPPNVQDKQDAILALFDLLLVEDNDALELLKADLRSTAARDSGRGGAGSSARAADPTQLLMLQRYFHLRKLRHTVRRYLLMLSQMRDKLGGAGLAAAAAAGRGGGVSVERKGTTADDLARVYTAVIQHLAETSALLDAAEDAADLEQVELSSLSAKAHRTYYLASSCMGAGQWNHARALLERTSEYLMEADTLAQTISEATVCMHVHVQIQHARMRLRMQRALCSRPSLPLRPRLPSQARSST